MNNNSEIFNKIKERIRKSDDISIEMARIGIDSIFKDNPELKEDIDKVFVRDGGDYED